ncbi:MAG: hypothetical protein QNK37_00550 [Acidobacteriota bacterium]|nr:hypothetical protein [Acidobacteriota bacterium]
MVLRHVLLAAGLLLISIPLLAQDEEDTISTERPGFGDSAGTVKKGTLQVEMGFAYNKFDDQTLVPLNGDKSASQKDFGELLLRYGLSDKLELAVTGGSFSSRNQPDQSGWSEVFVGLKYRFYDKNDMVMAVSGSLGSTTGITFSDRESQAQVAYALEKAMGERNLSFYSSYNEGDDELTLSLYIDGDLIEGWSYALGVASFLAHGEVNPVEELEVLIINPDGSTTLDTFWQENENVLIDAENQYFVDLNFSYTLTRDSQFDFYLGTGLDNKSPDFFFGLGYAHRF